MGPPPLSSSRGTHVYPPVLVPNPIDKKNRPMGFEPVNSSSGVYSLSTTPGEALYVAVAPGEAVYVAARGGGWARVALTKNPY